VDTHSLAVLVDIVQMEMLDGYLVAQMVEKLGYCIGTVVVRNDHVTRIYAGHNEYVVQLFVQAAFHLRPPRNYVVLAGPFFDVH
jgi:hypothetical protein